MTGLVLGAEVGLVKGDAVGLVLGAFDMGAFDVGADDGVALGAEVGLLKGDAVGLVLGAFDTGDFDVGADEGLDVVGLTEGLFDVDGGLLIVGDGVENSNRSETLVKCEVGKLPLFGQT